jgi:HTH-type transcriptional regulator/antitoxin HigA
MATPVQFAPDYASSPGHYLATILDQLGMSQSELAARTGLSQKHINQIIKKNVPVSAETAAQLEYATNVNAEVWSAINARYLTHLARTEARGRFASMVDWLDQFKLKELKTRGVISTSSKTAKTVEELVRYFGIAGPEGWERVWTPSMASFRRSPSFAPDTAATTVWLRAAQKAASHIRTRDYDEHRLRSSLPELLELTLPDPSDEVLRELQDRLASVGVALVYVSGFEGCRASGATWWESATKAVVVLSNRGKREDRFWFSLFHELGHVHLHAKRNTYLDSVASSNESPPWSEAAPASGFIDDDTRDSKQEQEADAFAGAILVPEVERQSIRSATSEQDIKAIAARIGVCPGIVAGRYQFEHQNYTKFNNLRRSIPDELFSGPL